MTSTRKKNVNGQGFSKTIGLGAALIALSGCTGASRQLTGEAPKKKPNVILVMTDDQGYGDLGCHGNPVIETPNLDKLYPQCVRLTNFHVAPTCSPTRAGLMTGRYCNRTGVWHTVMGRSLLRKDEVTMADVFKIGGYKTGIFGKWHLGDNYPFRPQDRGFDEVLIHGGGGIGNTQDYWDNDYFDDTYLHNGKPEKFAGYCTDGWFDNALKFIETNKDQPFFCYIPTNAPHGPLNVAEKYSKPYKEKGVPEKLARLYGTITNIDENMGRLEKKLESLGIKENTILIYMTDNGGGGGRYNAGMRGKKASVYEGGHRVPCFIRWPGGGVEGRRDVDKITAHIDILPSLIELCGLKKPKKVRFDGTSLVPLLEGKVNSWPRRTLVVDNQRLEYLRKYKQFAVMTDKWRLVGNYGSEIRYHRNPEEVNQPGPIIKSPRKELELYDVKVDPGQKRNVADKHPDVVDKLFEAYEKWWADVSKRSDEYNRIILGSPQENPAVLTAHDWHFDKGQVPWNQKFIRRGILSNGFWAVEISRSGRYKISLRRWPKELDKPITAGIPAKKGEVPGLEIHKRPPGKALNIKEARLKIGDVDMAKQVSEGAKEVIFEMNLKKGKTRMQTWFITDNGESLGAYYVYVKRLK